ncbi:MAG: hypothetical protein JSV04_00030 [Candidatus Heimdallarchaeota archaeon]|nr:MAG: hypothetical protein JSV04_00030 [Candidatus Heimdallarchaeota archaeon]
MKEISAKTIILLLIITLSSWLSNSPSVVTVTAAPNITQSDDELIVVDIVNIEVKKQDRFLPLEEFIPETPVTEDFQNPLPQLLNKSSLRINASYSTAFGTSETIVIHQFTLDVYSVITGEDDKLNRSAVLSAYYAEGDPNYEIPLLILEPNSSKSEALVVPSLELPAVGTYKFVFRVQYHIYEGDTDPRNSYYHQNMTFELVKSYPTPPYIIFYAFLIVSFFLIALVFLGIYGNRKYKSDG